MTYKTLQLDELLTKFAEPTSTPGGGSAAALSASLGVSLVAMVAGLTAKSKKFSDRRERMEQIAKTAFELKDKLADLITEDSVAYDGVSAAFKLPKETDEQKTEREKVIQVALKGAAEVPYSTLTLALDALRLAVETVENGNPNCITDGVAGALLLEAGINAAKMNICINLESITDKDYIEAMNAKVAEARTETAILSNRIRVTFNLQKGCAPK